jgi:hypothetical protein
MTRKRKLGKAAKWYEATCAREIEKYRAIGVEATDEQFRTVLDARLLRCMMEASRPPAPTAPDDERGGLEAV